MKREDIKRQLIELSFEKSQNQLIKGLLEITAAT